MMSFPFFVLFSPPVFGMSSVAAGSGERKHLPKAFFGSDIEIHRYLKEPESVKKSSIQLPPSPPISHVFLITAGSFLVCYLGFVLIFVGEAIAE